MSATMTSITAQIDCACLDIRCLRLPVTTNSHGLQIRCQHVRQLWECAMQCPVWSVSLPCVAGLHAYRDLEAPLMMMSWRGWGLLTGQMCTKLGSVNCATCLPVEASSKSMGCSATPPKSSLMYLQVQTPFKGRAVMLDLTSSSVLVCFVCV